MRTIRTYIRNTICAAALLALPAYASEPGPSASPTPTATPHLEPTATPTPTPHFEPSTTPTPTPTPHSEPSPTGTPGGDGHHGQISLRGFYEGTTPTGAVALFYVSDNSHVAAYVLDVPGQVIGFAEGPLYNGLFSLKLTTGQALVGSIQDNGVTYTLAGQSLQAMRMPTFGSEHTVAGQYFGVANGPTGESRVMFLIDTNGNIVMIQHTGTTYSGGYGKVTAPVSPATLYNFTLNNVVGSSSTVTGSFSVIDGSFVGTFTTSAGTFTVNTFKNSLANHMANISTRGLVGPGQGQLIGGFIITGGPKAVLIRAVGPSLAAAGVSPALANPSLQLFAGSTLLASNDDWKTNANAAQIVASTLAPTNDLESALLVRLEPGAYTTVVSGATDSAAIALVEVYEAGFE
ncbi:MAG: hypothetical protein ACJ8KU_08605 [Chthoniobacterales bacterium]